MQYRIKTMVNMLPKVAKQYDVACEEVLKLEEISESQWELVSTRWIDGYGTGCGLVGVVVGIMLAGAGSIAISLYKAKQKKTTNK